LHGAISRLGDCFCNLEQERNFIHEDLLLGLLANSVCDILFCKIMKMMRPDNFTLWYYFQSQDLVRAHLPNVAIELVLRVQNQSYMHSLGGGFWNNRHLSPHLTKYLTT
jgi:hypothetical protein